MRCDSLLLAQANQLPVQETVKVLLYGHELA